jgi:transposase
VSQGRHNGLGSGSTETDSKSVAAELGVHEHTVGKWRRRLLKDRCDGLLDEARPGRPRTIDDDQVAAVIERTLRNTPADATHWSIRSMAAETGFSHTTIRRMWMAFGLQPHRSHTFKLSDDQLFVAHPSSTLSCPLHADFGIVDSVKRFCAERAQVQELLAIRLGNKTQVSEQCCRRGIRT